MTSDSSALRTKICGLTCPADAVAAVVAGPSAIGLNFFPKSKRYITVEVAAEIASVLPPSVLPVGVFVDENANEIAEICQTVPLSGVQLHGKETPEDLAAVREAIDEHLVIIKALSTANASIENLMQYIEECRRSNALPNFILLDAAVGDKAGAGEVADWDKAREFVAAIRECRAHNSGQSAPDVVLAGGLSPANVAAAIEAVKPDGVDVASGVEASPGSKDPRLMAEFVKAAQSAFQGLS